MNLPGEKNDQPSENPISDEEKKWFVVYTRSRAEKKVWEEMKYLGIEAYVPLQKVIRQWKDRRKTIEEPLIRCYVFVRLSPMKRDLVFKSMHAVYYVTFNGKPAMIPDHQIDSLKRLVAAEVPMEATLQQFRPGEKVRVFYGPMSGVTGEFISMGSEKRFLLRIDNLGYSLIATIPAAWVEKVE